MHTVILFQLVMMNEGKPEVLSNVCEITPEGEAVGRAMILEARKAMKSQAERCRDMGWTVVALLETELNSQRMINVVHGKIDPLPRR